MSCGFLGGVGCIYWQSTPTPCLCGRFLLRFWPTRCVGFVRRLRGGYAVLFGADLFSPTAIALGSSAIVKVSGQRFCKFGGVSAFLGQIRFGLQKVPPRFHQGGVSAPGQIRFGLGHRWNWNQKPMRMPTQNIRGGYLSLGIKPDFPSLLAATTSIVT